VAEFIGTYMLVLTVGCNVLTGSPVWGVTSIACTLMVCIYALRGVSGANFNPAVSVALGVAKQLEWNDVGIYVCVQLVAGITAGLSYGVTLWHVFNLAPSPGFQWWQAALAEMIYTFMLCFVVLNTACSKATAGNQFNGLAIGFVVVAGGYGAGHISGGCFNPAVAWGIDVSSAGIGFGWCLAYTAFELVGAVAAALLFKACRPGEGSGEDPPEGFKYELGPRLVSEFIGTYMLVLTVGLNVIGGSKAPVFSIAASLMCMIFALGSCSGAHFNPAVTVAILISQKNRKKLISSSDAGAYIGTQIMGGVCASLTYAAMEGGKTFPLGPGKGYGMPQVALAEIFFTFLLCYVVLSVATVEALLSEYFGLAIGSCVTAGGYAIGAVSGGSLNPAVSIGISTAHVMGGGAFVNCILYSIFELIGGVIAAGLFMQTHKKEFSKAEPEYDAQPARGDAQPA